MTHLLRLLKNQFTKAFLAFGLFLVFTSSAFGQKYMDMIADETVNFFDVQKEADRYFDSVGTGRGTGYKQYKRWEYETSLEIDENGNRISKKVIEEETKKARARFARTSEDAQVLSATWTELGPDYMNATSGWNPGVGRVTAIAVEPVNQQLIYVGTPEGGLWKSTNGGTSWSPMFDQNNNMRIFAVTIDPANSNIVYVGTNGAGIYKTTNGGSTWSTMSFTTSKVGKIIIQPGNSNIILAATAGGIYRSTNAGGTWTRTSTVNVEDIEFRPGNPNTVYATGNSAYRSLDNGITWNQITNGISTTGRTLVSVTPANPNVVYLLQAIGSVYGRTFKSTDGGNSFTIVNSGSAGSNNLFGYETNGSGTTGQATYDMAMCVSPTNENEVHVAGIICWKSTNGGVNFTATTAWTWGNSIGYNHADVHVLEYVGNNIYSGSDGGIYKSVNRADDWVDLSRGLGIRQFYRLGVCKTNPNVYSGGSQDNGTSVFTGGVWKDWLGADGMESFVDHGNTNILYGTSQNGSLYRSTNGGNSRSSLPSPESSGNWVTPFIMDPKISTTLYVGYVQIYKSTNSGSNWTAISNFSGTTKANDIQVAESNSNYIYVIRGSQIMVTRNGGSTWTAAANAPNGVPNSIAIHPTTPERVALCTSTGKVYVSTDGGTSWTDFSASLPALPAYKVVYDNRAQGGIYVGLRRGVYYRDNTMTDWTPYIHNLPYAPVYDLEFHAQSNRIYAITHGRGVWYASAYGGNTGTPPAVSITSPSNNATFTSPANITITANASDADGTISKVVFYNGNTVIAEDNTSPYSIVWNNVATGTYQLKAVAIDNSNLSTTSATVNISVQNPNQSPTVSITSPANNASFNAPANISFTSNASDPDGTVTRVEYFNGTTKIGEATTSPYTFNWSNVAAGTYSITARATDNSNASTTSSAITINVVQPATCAVPTSLEANNITSSSANLTWTTQTGAVSYLVFVRPVGGSWLTSVTSTTNSVNFTGLQASTQYEFTVRTNCSSTSSAYASPYFRFTTAAVVATCNVPGSLGANNITTSSANLTWSAQTGAVSYLVFVRPVGGSWLTSVTSNTNSVNFTGLQASTEYEFTVRTNCSSTSSAYASPYFRFTTAAVVATCNVPGSLGANNITTSSANLTWTAQTGAVSYLVFVRPVGGAWLTSVTTNTNSVNFTGLQASTQYEFTVRTNCSSTSSAYASPYFRFTTTTAASCSAPAWNSTSIYVADNRVSHKGIIWRAKWWTQGEEPGTTGQWGVWEQVGTCSGAAVAEEETEIVLSANVIAAPHPFSSQTTISLSNGEKILVVNIYDVQGKLVSSVKGNNTDNLTVGDDLGAGLFIMQIITNNGSYKRNIIKTY
ncbi:MAG: Ig-like domain-containing protein [Cytophagaceae bacterium]